MININGANFRERTLAKKVEKACFKHLGQNNFFVTDISVVLEEDIRRLNSDCRGVDRVTDVLSFPCFDSVKLPVEQNAFSDCDYDGKRVLLGSIVICRKRAQEQAVEYGHGYDREFGFLVCHGFLHLLGFDHVVEDDEKIMISHQNEIMDGIGLKR